MPNAERSEASPFSGKDHADLAHGGLAVPPSTEPRRLTFGQHVWGVCRELFVVAVGAVIVASLLRGFVGQMFLIPSSSMENTLLINDRVLVEKLSSVKRGEVVVFRDPGGWLSDAAVDQRGPVGKALEFVGALPHTATEHLIKRVIGLPGDHVICCDSHGRVTVNDRPLLESRYLYTSSDGLAPRPSAIRFDVLVPSNRIFVMGDNRDDSRDSRCHLNDVGNGTVRGENAFVSEDLVVGRAIAVVWPLSRAMRLPIPATFSTVPNGKTPAPPSPVIHAGPEASC